MQKISEIFEGKDSSLYKTYRESVKTEKIGNSREKIRTSERAELIREMLDIINQERKDTRWLGPACTARGLAVKLAHIPTKDFYGILSLGKDYKNRNGSFSKYLFGALKVKK